MNDFEKMISNMYVAPIKVNAMVRSALGMRALQPIPRPGNYPADNYEEFSPPKDQEAKTLHELMGVSGGFSLIDDKIVMSHSSIEMKKRFQIKLLGMVAFKTRVLS